MGRFVDGSLRYVLSEAGWLPLRGLTIHRSDVYLSPVGLLQPDRKLAPALLPKMNRFRMGGRIMAMPHLTWPEEDPAATK